MKGVSGVFRCLEPIGHPTGGVELPFAFIQRSAGRPVVDNITCVVERHEFGAVSTRGLPVVCVTCSEAPIRRALDRRRPARQIVEGVIAKRLVVLRFRPSRGHVANTVLLQSAGKAVLVLLRELCIDRICRLLDRAVVVVAIGLVLNVGGVRARLGFVCLRAVDACRS